MLRRGLAVLVGFGVVLVAPAAAGAATVALTTAVPPNINYVAAAGETNNVAIALSGGAVTFTETGAGVVLADGDGAGGCSVAANVGTCPVVELNNINVDLDDMDDIATVSAPHPVTLNGEGGNDTLTGGPDNDNLNGGAGTDTLSGGDGGDTLTGADDPDTINGGNGSDTVNGNAGADTLNGDGGNDTVRGHDGADSLTGGSGNDDLIGSLDADQLTGGTGRDEARYTDHAADVSVSFDGAANDGAAGEGDNVGTDVEDAQGGNGNDTLTGSAEPNSLSGGQGNDTLTGGDEEDTLNGGGGDDNLSGEGGDDDLDGDDGNDTLAGGAGDDFVDGEEGTDDISGGAGRDESDYSHAGTEGSTVTLDNQPGDGAPGENDNVHSDVEDLGGSEGPDTLTGTGAPNNFSTGTGADVVNGKGGADHFFTSDGDDRLIGGGGNDELDPGEGADVVNGGKGNDLADYYRSTPVTVKLDGKPNDGEAGEGDNVAGNVEEVWGGSADDVLVGNKGNNALMGFEGNDRLTGGGGNDELMGDHPAAFDVGGNDVLNGGSGRDLFIGGPANDKINSKDGSPDQVGCGGGTDTVTTKAGKPRDSIDADCEKVKRKKSGGKKKGGKK